MVMIFYRMDHVLKVMQARGFTITGSEKIV